MKRWILNSAVICIQLSVGGALAEDTNNAELIQRLQKRLDELEQKVKVLERSGNPAPQEQENRTRRDVQEQPKQPGIAEQQPEYGRATWGTNAPGLASLSLGSQGLIVRSADSNFLMNIHGYVQADARFYENDHNPANDTFLLRRVRPIIEGTVYDRFDYRFMPDFGSGNVAGSTAGNNAVLDDAYVNARFLPDLQIQVGKYKSPVGLERLQSTAEPLFIESGFATQ